MNKPEEYLDLVNQDDEVVAREKRSVIYEKGLNNYRVINAFIMNSEGKLWIPRRTAHKKIYPLSLDMSAGGHVESGSTYEETFAKEVMEELNIDVNKVPWREIGYFKVGELGLSSFMKVYEIKLNEVPDFNPEDFIEYYWLNPQEFVDKAEREKEMKNDLPILIKNLYL